MNAAWLSALAERGAHIEAGRIIDFGDPGREAQATGKNTTLTALLNDGLILASGEDAQAFLQGQLSNDVTEVSPGRGQLSAYCTPKGRVLATLLLSQIDTGYALQLSRELAEPLRKRLQMFVMRSRVRLLDASDQMAVLGVAGADAPSLVRRRLGLAPASIYAVAVSDGVTAIRLPGDRVQLMVEIGRAAETWDRVVGGCVPVGQEGWEWHGIAAGVPAITAATQDQFVPQMLNLELLGGVSFQKGCYTGQEIVARSQHLGQVKRRLARYAAAQGDVPPGAAVYAAEQQVGAVVNAARSPGGGWELLAVVPIEAAQIDYAGPPLRLGRADDSVLRPLPLPYSFSLPNAPAQRTGDAKRTRDAG
jgi:folate-binding protein YgfZ